MRPTAIKRSSSADLAAGSRHCRRSWLPCRPVLACRSSWCCTAIPLHGNSWPTWSTTTVAWPSKRRMRRNPSGRAWCTSHRPTITCWSSWTAPSLCPWIPGSATPGPRSTCCSRPQPMPTDAAIPMALYPPLRPGRHPAHRGEPRRHRRLAADQGAGRSDRGPGPYQCQGSGDAPLCHPGRGGGPRIVAGGDRGPVGKCSSRYGGRWWRSRSKRLKSSS